MSIFKYAVNTNCLRNDKSISEIVQICTKAGVDGIEWGLPSLDKAKKDIREMARITRDEGLEVLGYLNAGHLWKTDLMKEYSELVASVNGRLLRVTTPWLAFDYSESLHQKDSYVDLQKRCREGLERLVPLSEQYGIRYLIEMHLAGVCSSADAVRILLDGLSPACVGAIYDPGNGILEGFTRPRHALEVLGPYHAYTHAKNINYFYSGHQQGSVKRAAWGYKLCSLDSGVVDFLEVCFALKTVGYRGWISFEDFFVQSPETEIAKALAFMQECEEHAESGPAEPFTSFNL